MRTSMWYEDLITLVPPIGILSSNITRDIEGLIVATYILHEKTIRFQLSETLRIEDICIGHCFSDVS